MEDEPNVQIMTHNQRQRMISRQVGMELAQGVHPLMNDRENKIGTVDAKRLLTSSCLQSRAQAGMGSPKLGMCSRKQQQ